MSQITIQLFRISSIYNLSTVEKNVYAQKEKAKAFNSNTLKKSLIHSVSADHILSSLSFSKKWIFADINIGYQKVYHIANNINTIIANQAKLFCEIKSLKYWNSVSIDSHFSNLYVSKVFTLYAKKNTI